MSIELRYTESLIRELKTDGHAPMKFLCDDMETYYCKYRLNMKPVVELDYLVYEVLGQKLLKFFNLETPEIAFVQVKEGSFKANQLKKNSTHLSEDVVCFGSKYVDHIHVDEYFQANKRTEVTRIANAEEIIKIALFDLWTENTDRGKKTELGYNYNLMLQKRAGMLFLTAFDNAMCFGGENGLRVFNTKMFRVNSNNKLPTSPFYKSIVSKLKVNEKQKMVEEFLLMLQSEEWKHHVSEAIDQCKQYWPVHSGLKDKMIDFLSDNERNRQLINHLHLI